MLQQHDEVGLLFSSPTVEIVLSSVHWGARGKLIV